MQLLFAVFDLLLAFGLTLRLARLVIIDDIGGWWIRGPLYRWAGEANDQPNWNWNWKQKLVSGISCPWCVGFWIGCLALASLAVFGGPGDVWEPWRWVAGAFTLNWVAAHLGARLGDAGYAEDDD